MKKFKKHLRKNNGITLIALVITIVVLIILAGIAISMISGENGLLTKATEAKYKTETASRDEQAKLAQALANLNTEETEFNVVKIPAGFEPTKIEGESTTDEGLVIIDSNGNEFVWIEVPKEITADASTSDEISEALNNYAIDYRLTFETDAWYDGCGLTKEEYNEKKSEMLYSIKENGGFWIGRYESGTKEIRTDKSDELGDMIVQKDSYPYNFVTVEQAQTLANNLSNNNYTVSLLFGIQWDLTCKFIAEKNAKTMNEIKTNSNSWGNYIGDNTNNVSFEVKRGEYSLDYGLTYKKINGTFKKENSVPVLFTTGASERNKVLNIYDFAGNVNEWTLERIVSTSPAVFRSGAYVETGDGYSAWVHPNRAIDTSNSQIGFRVTIY